MYKIGRNNWYGDPCNGQYNLYAKTAYKEKTYIEE